MKEVASSVGSGSENKSAGGASEKEREAPPSTKPEPTLAEFLKVQSTIATAIEHWSPDTQRRMLGSVATVLGISRQASQGQARRGNDPQQQPRTQQGGNNSGSGGQRRG